MLVNKYKIIFNFSISNKYSNKIKFPNKNIWYERFYRSKQILEWNNSN